MNDRALCEKRDVDALYDAAFEGNFLKSVISLIDQHIPPEVMITLLTNDRDQRGCNTVLHRSPANSPANGSPASANGAVPDHWLSPLGAVYHYYGETAETAAVCTVGAVISRTAQHQTLLELSYAQRLNDTLRPRLRKLLEAVAPHLMRSFRIEALRGHDLKESRITTGVLNLLPFPAFILTDGGLVQKLNDRALALVRRMDSLLLAADHGLHAVNTDSDTALRAVLEQLGTSHLGRAQTIAIKTTKQQESQLVTLTRLTGIEPPNNGLCGPRLDAAQTMVMVHDRADQLSISRDMLWNTFEMNSKEVDLALSLLNGETIGDYALRRHVSKQTLRNQLSGIMRKTDTTRQSELVGLLTRLALSPTH